MARARVYDWQALQDFYAKHFPYTNIMSDWWYLDRGDHRIGIRHGSRNAVFGGTADTPIPPEAEHRVSRALAECPWVDAEID